MEKFDVKYCIVPAEMIGWVQIKKYLNRIDSSVIKTYWNYFVFIDKEYLHYGKQKGRYRRSV